MDNETYVVHRAISDFVGLYGGPLQVPITKELLQLASGARVRQQNHRIQVQQQKASEEKLKKKQQEEEELLEMKKIKLHEEVCNQLSADADRLAFSAEEKKGERRNDHLDNTVQYVQKSYEGEERLVKRFRVKVPEKNENVHEDFNIVPKAVILLSTDTIQPMVNHHMFVKYICYYQAFCLFIICFCFCVLVSLCIYNSWNKIQEISSL